MSGATPPKDDDIWPALSLRFSVKIDSHAAWVFTGVKGLIVENEVLPWSEGGENSFQHKLPGRALYRDVTLTRNTDSQTHEILTWVDTARRERKVGTAAITAYDSYEDVVAIWSLVDVWPLRYTGPTFDSNIGALAKETLELSHAGFTVKLK